jgi:hypothetical protein
MDGMRASLTQVTHRVAARASAMDVVIALRSARM